MYIHFTECIVTLLGGIHNIRNSCHEQICLKRLCFWEIHLPSSGPRPDKMGEVSGITASLNAFCL